MRYIILTFLLLALSGFNQFSEADQTEGKTMETTSMEYLKIPFNTIDGKETKLEDFKGKAVLLVNTASKCGFTPQYAGLQELYDQYKDRDFVIIGFPANNFMNQEPGSNEEIAEFCSVNYGVTFPMMEKISVSGKKIHPLYKYLTKESPHSGKITWNFNKFLLDQSGEVVNRFSTRTKPKSEKITSEIEKLLTN